MTMPYRSTPPAPNHESDSALIAGRYKIAFLCESGDDLVFEVVEYGRKRSWFGFVIGPLVEERRYSVRGDIDLWYDIEGYDLTGAALCRHLNAAATRYRWNKSSGR